MKFFTKLFLCILLVLTAALSFAEYYTVSSTLRSAVEHQTQEALQQHQLVKYAIQSSMLTAARNTEISQATLTEIANQTAESLSVQLTLEEAEEQAEAGYLTYSIREEGEADLLTVTSSFSQSGQDLTLTTVSDITYVFTESRELEKSCRRVFLAAAAAGSLLTLLLSWLLTRPVKRLEQTSRAFAEGDYSARLKPTSRDEIGDLTRTYNAMADTIREKIDALELAVRQREDFVAAFAHEIKTPMTSIIGYADTLYQKELPTGRVQEAAGYILNEGLRLEALSFKLLELITLERQTFLLEEMEMGPFFDDLREAIAPLAQKRGLAVEFHCEPGYARMEYDLCKTMVLNLLDNALKSGGTLVTVTGQPRGRRYWIEIEDNGRGIPEEDLKRVTEAFYMVDKSRSRKEHGAGLGLALCRRIAAIHHTGLEFDSVEGVGTSVEFFLDLGGEVKP